MTGAVLWKADDGLPDTCSPLATRDFVFLMTSYGTLTCYDAVKGKQLWTEDFATDFSSSPSLVGNRVYLIAKSGHTWIIEPSRKKCKRLGEADLGEECVTCPAFQDGRMYLRGKTHCFAWVVRSEGSRMENRSGPHPNPLPTGEGTRNMSDLDLSFVDETIARLGRGAEVVIPILQAIQTHYRYVPREAIERICERPTSRLPQSWAFPRSTRSSAISRSAATLFASAMGRPAT